MRDQRSGVQSSGFHQRGELFHAQASAGHQTARKGFVAHAAAPFRPGDGDGFALRRDS